MNESKQKSVKIAVAVICLFATISLLCFGISGFLIYGYKNGKFTDIPVDYLIDISYVLILFGILLLIPVLSNLISLFITKKRKREGKQIDNIFNEQNMRLSLGKYVPDGEVLTAAIYAAGRESSVTSVFTDCTVLEDRLAPARGGQTVTVIKKKFSAHDLYLGVTQNYMIVADCMRFKYFYQFDENTENSPTKARSVTEDILLTDIGRCFPLENVQSCNVKKGIFGFMKCTIKMKNGDYFKVAIPKYSGGLAGDMPRQAEYRDRFLRQLCNKAA